MRFLYLTLFLLISISCTYGQVEKEMNKIFPYKNDLGINVTNVIGNVFSLNPDNENSPYSVLYRRHFLNWSLRSGFNIKINKSSTDDFLGSNFISRNLDIFQLDTRVGIEKHIVLSRKFVFSYGWDLLGRLIKENSEILNFNSNFTSFESAQNTFGIGTGPIVRFDFKITDRIIFSTETTLYGIYSRTTESLLINGTPSEEPQKTSFNLNLQLPQSLYVNVAF